MSMTTAEKDDAIQLVHDIQKTRASNKLKPDQVPHVLLPYQAAWHADHSPVRVCKKGRRIGFSWGALAAEAALIAARVKGMNQYYMGYNMAMAAEFIGDAAFFAKAYQQVASAFDVTKETEVIGDERRDIVTYKIQFASGWKVEALSSCPYNWRSRQGHARIDEAAFHENLEEVIKGAMAFLMWGGRMDLVSTLNGENEPFYLLCKDVEAGKLPWSLHTVSFDDALRQGFYKRVCLIRDLEYSLEAEKKYRAEVYANYPSQEDADEELNIIAKRGTGAYFTRLLLENCHREDIPTLHWSKPAAFVLDPNRLKIAAEWIRVQLKPVIDSLPTDRRTAYGQDFGRTGDLSVMWVLQEYGPTWRLVFAVELRSIPFDVQKLIMLHILKELPLFHHAKFDARGNGQSHAEAALQEFGEQKVDCVMFTQSWYAEWFPKYRQAYETQSIQLSATEDVIADHRLVQLVNGKPAISGSRVKGSDGLYRHGDSAVAGVLAWAAAMEENAQWSAVATSNKYL